MKNRNTIEKIAIAMLCTEKNAPNPSDVVSDNTIIESISQIVDLETKDRDGRTLLINAAFYERKKVIEYLLFRGADINAHDKMGFTALHAAVQTGNVEIVSLLLNIGADANSKNAFGNSPLMMCGHLMPLELFELLIHYGADPRQKNEYGVSAADIFAAYPQIVSLILKS